MPYILSAIRMMESGFATAEDIDTGMVEGCNHPMGPLRLADLIGLDVCLAILRVLHEGFADEKYAHVPRVMGVVYAVLSLLFLLDWASRATASRSRK